ncbi:CPBP family intramembrane glutamic endopeptidase [Blastococcus sp. PRF04-17]|uniref:CPBP family intramembrane glutamic endopeptidase n=1 Tax=Blastococcus sp. PRF04-17 TaxID=2933797 RepID=UPI001FF567E6|nr:CPBP family intramembrane glutamic endopeptidase [Blastococcus sp. PRF04-17]UOY01476.1 CPBP family intramembrane metalloprotease [Blastococcus sp. PRF04-17]
MARLVGGPRTAPRLVVVGPGAAALAADAAVHPRGAGDDRRRHRAVGPHRLPGGGRGTHRPGGVLRLAAGRGRVHHPLQSAAEEYLFRGYLSQAITGWFRRPGAGAVVAGLVTAAVFSVAHVPADWPTFLDRFAFGLAASAVVWLTGGLEAAIVLHAVNNVLVFVLAGSLGDGVATDELPEGTGLLYLALSLVAMAAYVLLVRRAARRLRPETHTAAQDLRPVLPAAPAPVR